MTFDRFQAPSKSDDLIACAVCGRRVHYEDCAMEENICSECLAEWPEDDVKNCEVKDRLCTELESKTTLKN